MKLGKTIVEVNAKDYVGVVGETYCAYIKNRRIYFPFSISTVRFIDDSVVIEMDTWYADKNELGSNSEPKEKDGN